jgi:hypothetical protein
MDTGTGVLGFVPTWTEFSSSKRSTVGLGPTKSFVQRVFPSEKAGTCSNHSSPSNENVENVWSFTSIPAIRLHLIINLSLYLTRVWIVFGRSLVRMSTRVAIIRCEGFHGSPEHLLASIFKPGPKSFLPHPVRFIVHYHPISQRR